MFEKWTIEAVHERRAYFRKQMNKAQTELADRPQLLAEFMTACNKALDTLDRREELLKQGIQPDF